MSAIFRYLHLSDLHFSVNNPAGRLEEHIVARSLLNFIDENLKDELLDFIIVTGDIAFSGKKAEYDDAIWFLNRLSQITNVPQKFIYIVAGNHDVNRDNVSEIDIKMCKMDNQKEVLTLFHAEKYRDSVMQKFTEFNEFSSTIMGEERGYTNSKYHIAETISLNKVGQEFKINMLGLNSALLAGYDGDDTDKHLYLGLHQVDRALQELDSDAVLSIGFFHHPFDCYNKEDAVCERRLRQRLDLILTGHMHDPMNAYERRGIDNTILISAGATYMDRESSSNSFNIAEIDLSTGSGKVFFYTYLPIDNQWIQDRSVNRDKDGVFVFNIKEEKCQSIGNPPSSENDVHVLLSYCQEDKDDPDFRTISHCLTKNKIRFDMLTEEYIKGLDTEIKEKLNTYTGFLLIHKTSAAWANEFIELCYKTISKDKCIFIVVIEHYDAEEAVIINLLNQTYFFFAENTLPRCQSKKYRDLAEHIREELKRCIDSITQPSL